MWDMYRLPCPHGSGTAPLKRSLLAAAGLSLSASRRSHATTAPQMALVLAPLYLGIDNQAGQQGVQGIVLPPAAMDFKAQAPRVRAVQSFRQGEMQLEGWEPLGRTSHVKGHRDCTTMAFDLHVLGSSRLRVDGRTFVKMAK